MGYLVISFRPDAFRLADWLRDFPWISDYALVDGWAYSGPEVKPEAGETVFIWYSTGEEEGICGQARTTAAPEGFPLAGRKTEYLSGAQDEGQGRVALKYLRFCLGAPLLRGEMEQNGVKPDVTVPRNEVCRLYRLPDNEGKALEMMLRGRTNTISLPFCKT